MKKKFAYGLISFLLALAILCSLVSDFGVVAFAEGETLPSEEWYAAENFLNFSAMRQEIDALKASGTAKKVIVAVIDTGIISDHEVFDGIELVSPYNVILDSEDVIDDTAPSLKVTESRKYHGTHVTGIVARLVKEFGLESYVSVMPIKAGDAQATFRWDRAVTAIRYAADNGASVINMSFTNELSDKPSASYIQKLNEAVNYAYSKGAICVAAAGNQGRINANSFYPAACEKVIGVMAYNDQNKRYSKSNYNSEFTVVAPGENIVSSVKDGYQAKSGTSMAAPIVSFMAGVMMMKAESADEVYTAFKEFPSDVIQSGGFSLRKADLVKLLNFKPASKLKLTATVGGEEISQNGFFVNYFDSPTLTLNAVLLSLSESGEYVVTDTDKEISWSITCGENTENAKGKNVTIENLKAFDYNVTATVRLTSGVLTASLSFDAKVKYLRVVERETLAEEVSQTLGQTAPTVFDAYYGYTDKSGAVVEKKITSPVRWTVLRINENTASTSLGTELTLPAQTKVGEVEIYASLDETEGVSEDSFGAKLKVDYKKIDLSEIKEAKKTGHSVKYMGDRVTLTVGDYQNADPNAIIVAWYVNGELVTTAKSGEFNYLPTGSGRYEIVGYVNDVAVVKQTVRVLPTDKKATWILIAAAMAIAGSSVGLVVLLPKYKKQEKELSK